MCFLNQIKLTIGTSESRILFAGNINLQKRERGKERGRERERERESERKAREVERRLFRKRSCATMALSAANNSDGGVV